MLFNRPGQQFHAIKFDANGRVSGQAAFASVTLSIDGGPYLPLNDTNPTEVGTTGEYIWQLTQAETNGYELSFAPVTATAGVEILGMPSNVIYTTQPGLVGNFTRTIVVIDAATSLPIPLARVRLYTDSETETKETDGDGEATFATAAGTYNYVVRVSGYSGATGTIVVAGDGTTEIALNEIPIVDVSADTTALTFRISSQGNVSLAGIAANARLTKKGSTVVGETVGINIVEESTSDADGLVTLILFRERDYDLSIRRPNGTIYKMRITTGDGPSTLISAAIEI